MFALAYLYNVSCCLSLVRRRQSDGVANTVSDGASTTQNNWFIVNSKDKVTKKGNKTETIV